MRYVLGGLGEGWGNVFKNAPSLLSVPRIIFEFQQSTYADQKGEGIGEGIMGGERRGNGGNVKGMDENGEARWEQEQSRGRTGTESWADKNGVRGRGDFW